MKKVLVVLRIAVCALFMLSALCFAAIEGWQLFSKDWRLFENDLLALAQIAVRLLLCLYCFGISLRAALPGRQSCLWEGLQLLGIALAATPFVSNQLGVPFVLLAAVLLLLEQRLWRFLLGRKKKSPEENS